MLRWILALLFIPFLDAVLLAVVFSRTEFGWAAMVLLVVLTGLVGMLLVRAEGRRTMRKIQRSLAKGTPPTNELLDGALLIASGAFLLTPGLVTDLIGFLLVVPLTRIPIRAAIKRFVVVPYMDKKTDGFTTGKVWTFGFPDQGAAGGHGQGQNGPGGASSGGTDGTIDLGEDDYTVDSDGDDSYTIEFGDSSTDDRDEGEGDAR
ncbi:membrane protein FxsA [Halobacteria archaeon AArc-m2/3/4]|uniref:Membrane protein FxsA n=1 Tax=Natronoglomus mannanivorans TaxID=2979990 RepID=A0AAP3E0V1_9EURY|nr:membrane protein FxsA [Halobacteria archaeon AArc-xg1-1]MCU4972600.1 membrane protein FxsA [Halobacteria archaeon AArc-m2/3/4]